MKHHTPTELNNWDEPGPDDLPEYDAREFWPLLAVCLATAFVVIFASAILASIMEGPIA